MENRICGALMVVSSRGNRVGRGTKNKNNNKVYRTHLGSVMTSSVNSINTEDECNKCCNYNWKKSLSKRYSRFNNENRRKTFEESKPS